MAVANARMYSATPAVKAAWNELLRWVLLRADVDCEVIDYDAPAPLNALWARDDLGLTIMCGLPLSRRAPAPQLIAAPIPSPPRYGGQAVYMTDMVVRADSPYCGMQDTFGGVVGYTLPDSLSGGVVPRRFIEALGGHYREEVNSLVNPRGVIQALAERRIDVGPLDSYYHDLLRASDPSFAAQVRTIASTARSPIPPFVATAPLKPDEVQRLRDALLAVQDAPELQALRSRLLLRGFAVPDITDYQPLARMPS